MFMFMTAKVTSSGQDLYSTTFDINDPLMKSFPTYYIKYIAQVVNYLRHLRQDKFCQGLFVFKRRTHDWRKPIDIEPKLEIIRDFIFQITLTIMYKYCIWPGMDYHQKYISK